MASAPCCHQNKAKRCSICNRCSRCHYDECDGEHPAARGPAGDAIRERRRQARFLRESQENKRTYELRQTNVEDLNEDKLFKRIDDVLSSAIEPNSVEKPFVRVIEALGIDSRQFSLKLLRRASLLGLESLRSNGVLNSVVVGLDTVFRHIVDSITQCSDSFDVVYGAMRDRLVSDRHVDDGLSSPAQFFMRSANEMDERKSFALLLHMTKDKKKLEEALIDAKANALVDMSFMSNARPRHYFARPSSNTENDDEEVDETQSKAATVQVTLTVDDQLNKRVRWVHSKQKRARAIADWERLSAGLDLEPRWNKPRV